MKRKRITKAQRHTNGVNLAKARTVRSQKAALRRMAADLEAEGRELLHAAALLRRRA